MASTVNAEIFGKGLTAATTGAIGRLAAGGSVGIAVRETLPEGAYLDIHVKVEKHWQDRDEMLNRLGY